MHFWFTWKTITMLDATPLSSEISLTESVVAADLGVVPWVLAGMVASVVNWEEVTGLVVVCLCLLHSSGTKMQGSKRSLGTPPRTKAKLAIRTSVNFIMRYLKMSWNIERSLDSYTFFEIWMLCRLGRQMFVQFLEIQSRFNNLKMLRWDKM